MSLYKRTALIGAGTGWGAQKRTTEHGPDALKHFGLVEKLQQESFSVHWQEIIYAKIRFANDEDITPEDCFPYVLDMCQKVYYSVQKALHKKEFPCVIGGDHSIAIGTWSSIITALDAAGKFGLIWFDAHLDAHTPKTTPSSAFHGMPVASLMGHGMKEFTKLGSPHPKLDPKNVVFIGTRSYETSEHHLIKDLGVKIFYMKDIKKLGFATVLKQAIEIASEGTKGFGLSLDLDGFDPSVAPGVGSPVVGGLLEEDVIPFLHLIKEQSGVKALEISEYNPHLDKSIKTAQLVHKIVRELLTKG